MSRILVLAIVHGVVTSCVFPQLFRVSSTRERNIGSVVELGVLRWACCVAKVAKGVLGAGAR
jgi:hypothetical protein